MNWRTERNDDQRTDEPRDGQFPQGALCVDAPIIVLRRHCISVLPAVVAMVGCVATPPIPSNGRMNASPLGTLGEESMKEPLVFQRAIPDDLVVRLRLVPEDQQRYPTAGDWLWSGGTLEIRVSREIDQDDTRYTVLLFIHELIEALLCRGAGITGAQVDAFDLSRPGDDEPGDDPAAPYHRQHVAAEAAERALAEHLGVDWQQYLCR
jgi:hypothetical protein